MEYGAHLARYLEDNPDVAGTGLLAGIVEGIDLEDETRRGVAAGFLVYLQHRLVEGREVDPFELADRLNGADGAEGE